MSAEVLFATPDALSLTPHVRMLSAISDQFLSSGQQAHSSDAAMNYN